MELKTHTTFQYSILNLLAFNFMKNFYKLHFLVFNILNLGSSCLPWQVHVALCGNEVASPITLPF